ncbi:unnamed protein product [Arctogadus glacialis]
MSDTMRTMRTKRTTALEDQRGEVVVGSLQREYRESLGVSRVSRGSRVSGRRPCCHGYRWTSLCTGCSSLVHRLSNQAEQLHMNREDRKADCELKQGLLVLDSFTQHNVSLPRSKDTRCLARQRVSFERGSDTLCPGAWDPFCLQTDQPQP